jgi:hypothetical protein
MQHQLAEDVRGKDVRISADSRVREGISTILWTHPDGAGVKPDAVTGGVC